MGLPVVDGVGTDAENDSGHARVDVDAAPAKRRRISSSERLAVRFFKELEALLGCLTPDVLRALRPAEVAIFLGSNPLRPKEIFSFTLHDEFAASYHPHDDPTTVKDDAQRKIIGNAARRVIRECLPAVAACPPPASSSLKVFLMMRVPSRGGGGGGKKGGGAEVVIPEPPPGFIPKRGFVPLLRQTKVRVDYNVVVKRDRGSGGGGSDGSGSGSNTRVQGGGKVESEYVDGGRIEGAGESDEVSCIAKESVWYQCSASVKGLKGAGAL